MLFLTKQRTFHRIVCRATKNALGKLPQAKMLAYDIVWFFTKTSKYYYSISIALTGQAEAASCASS